MYFLGLHNDEDAGVTLLKDGQILDAIGEERLNRVKLYKGIPEKSLAYVLSKHRLSLSDIDYFVYGWHGRRNDYADYSRRLVRRTVQAMEHNHSAGPILVERVDTEFARDSETRAEFESWMASLGVQDGKILYLDHHSSHAWGAFACSPFDKAFVFTFDGRGDLKSTTVSIADSASGIKEQNYLLSIDSLGFLYGQITHYLGYTPHRHEGKVTGLAAYGDASKTLPLFRRLIGFEDGAIVAKIVPYKPFYTNLDQALIDELDCFKPEDIAAGVQVHCEDLVTRYISYWIKKIDRPDIRNVCLAGGIAANVKINQRVAELPEVDSVYVFPHMGDGGLPLGSACYANYLHRGAAKVLLDSVYLGPAFSDVEIEKELKSFSDQVSYVRVEDKVSSTVQDLVDEKVVGWFDGRMEYGPRSLGARSILYHTRDNSVNDWLNKRLRRTEFMPFAPVTPVEYAGDCYKGWCSDDACTPFMTKTFDCSDAFKAVHKAVVHIDGTARPQVVTEDRNGDYYRVVKGYCDLTGERSLINTSFNAHEEPIILSPRDAISGLLNNVVDVLVMGGFRVTQRSGYG